MKSGKDQKPMLDGARAEPLTRLGNVIGCRTPMSKVEASSRKTSERSSLIIDLEHPSCRRIPTGRSRHDECACLYSPLLPPGKRSSQLRPDNAS